MKENKYKSEDRQLVEDFKNGDQGAFDRLMQKHATKLFQIARSLLNNSEDAEEVVQDAFVRIFRSLHSFRGDAAFMTWARTIVINLARNKYHWLRRRGEHMKTNMYHKFKDSDIEQLIEFPDTSALNPEEQLRHNELENNIYAAFASLPPKLKEAMVLRHLEQLPYEKIAETLNCKCGTVKSRLARGREMLRKKIS